MAGTKEEIDTNGHIELDESLKLLGEAGVDSSVLEVLKRLKVISSAEAQTPEISSLINDVNHTVISCLVEKSISQRASRDCDKIIDDTETEQVIVNATFEEIFETKLKTVLTKILENLQKYFKIKGIGVVYDNPLTKNPREINTEGISDGRVTQVAKDYNPQEHFHPYGDEFHHIREMKFGTRKLGHIDFIFSDIKNSKLMTEVADAVNSVIDTFLDNQLKKILKNYIEDKKREIIEKNYSETEFKWRNIITELLEMLEKMGLEGMLLCKRFDAQKSAITQFDTTGKITEKTETEGNTIRDMVMQLGFDFKGTQDITYPNLQKFLGTFLFNYNNATDEEMARFICECLSDVLRQREDIRYELVKSIGLRYANAIIDHNVETQGKHEIVTLIGDINGYSSWTREISECVKKGIYNKDPLPEIMDSFSEEISTEIDRDEELKGVLDKIVGDEVIIHFRLPFNKEGKDIEGKADGEHDISLFIQRALKMCAKVQNIFDKVLKKVESKHGIKLPRYPKFSFGIKSYEDVVGIYGNLKNPESRIQITVFGPGINETARIQSGAKAGAVLVEEKTWEKYKTGANDEFDDIGLPIIILGKNIKDPIHAVTVNTKEEISNMKTNQRRFFTEQDPLRRKYYEDNPDTPIPYYYCNEETMHMLPDGDYTVAMHNDEPDGPLILEVALDAHRFKIKLQRDKINNLQYPVGQKSLDKLEKERKQYDCSRRTTLRLKNNKFYLIKYVDIEEIIKEEIEKIKSENRKSQQVHLSLEQLPSGRYEIIDKVDEKDGDIMLTLSRSGSMLKLLIQENEKNAVIGQISGKGYVEHMEGCLYF